MNRRIILVGKGGSGKDYFKEYLRKLGVEVDVSYTTRAQREGEIEGQTYHYVSEHVFNKYKHEGKFYEDVEFNGWKYATTVKDWEEKKLCIKTPSGIKQLTTKDIDESIIIYFDIDRNIRYERLKKRVIKGDPEVTEKEIGRRLAADTMDFLGFSTYHIRVTNENFNPHRLLETIKKYDKI